MQKADGHWADEEHMLFLFSLHYWMFLMREEVRRRELTLEESATSFCFIYCI